MRIAAILTDVAFPIPFGHLHQLDQVGISNIIILLSAEELTTAQAKKFTIFDNTEPKTIIEHYQSQSKRLKIEIMNTEKANTEEEKLNFYQEHAKDRYQLNLFLCKGSVPGLNEEISAKPPATDSFTFSFLVPLYTSTARKNYHTFKVHAHQIKSLIFCKRMPYQFFVTKWLLLIY